MDNGMKFMVGLAVFLFLIGIMWSKGKWLNLMAGYNALTEEEKKNVNLKKIKKYGSIIMYGSAVMLLVFPIMETYVSSEFIKINVETLIIVLFISFVIFCSYKGNRNEK